MNEAREVLELLGEQGDASAPERPVGLALPSSWFADFDDPVKDHPLFVRFLPERRNRADWEIPGVHVRASDDLEPDGYEIAIDDELVASGRVPRDWQYCADEAVSLLPLYPRTLAEPADIGVSRVPEGVIEGGFAELLTMSSVERVVRLLGEAVRDHQPGQTGDPQGPGDAPSPP